MSRLELSSSVFSILSGLIEEKLGLHYTLLDRDILQDKSSARALEAGFDSMLDYYYFLRYDPAGSLELKELGEALVVNETYFFREWVAIEALVNTFIAPLVAQGNRPRIWSAACSSGEEPLSLAMLLDDLQLLDKVDIVGSDISTKVLAKAQKGIFGKRSVRNAVAPKLLSTYLEAGANDYTVMDRLIKKIQWKQLNLLDEIGLGKMGNFDAILCRNVLIYFSDTTIRSLLERFSNTLNKDGLLLVGVSESLLRYGNTFTGEERSGAFVYRKSSET